MGKFVQDQEIDLQDELLEKYNLAPVDVVHKVIDRFVTEEGTKHPVPYIRRKGLIIPDSKFKELISSSISEKVLSACFIGLEKRRILRYSDNYIELGHDSIAALIHENRTDQEIRLNRARRSIMRSYIEHRENNEVLLTEGQINAYKEDIPFLDLDEGAEEFIRRSEEEVARLKRNKFRSRVFPIVTAFAILLFIVSVIAFFQKRNAVEARNEAVEAKNDLTKETIKSTLILSKSLKNEGNYAQAVNSLNNAKNDIIEQKLSVELKDTLTIIDAQISNYNRIQRFVVEGDSILEVVDFTDTLKLEALKRYEYALAIESDSRIKLKKENVETLIKQTADTWYERARIYAQFGDRDGVLGADTALIYAMKLNPNPPDTMMIVSIKALIANKKREKNVLSVSQKK